MLCVRYINLLHFCLDSVVTILVSWLSWSVLRKWFFIFGKAVSAFCVFLLITRYYHWNIYFFRFSLCCFSMFHIITSKLRTTVTNCDLVYLMVYWLVMTNAPNQYCHVGICVWRQFVLNVNGWALILLLNLNVLGVLLTIHCIKPWV